MLRLAPPLTVLLFIGPVVAGLLGTALPAFGWLPALGAAVPSLEPWRRLARLQRKRHNRRLRWLRQLRRWRRVRWKRRN